MNCYVYVLGSGGDRVYRTYVGWTIDLERRLDQHNSGVGAERYDARSVAMRRGWHLKRDRRFRKLSYCD